MSDAPAIRFALQQGALPKYRLPGFAELARRPGIDLKVIYGDLPGIPNAPAEGFPAEHHRLRYFRLGRHPVLWHGAQWKYATPKHADVLLLSWDLHYALLVPALLRARWNGVGTILWGHGYSKRESGIRRRLRNAVARLASAILLYNHAARQRMLDEGFEERRIFVALNSLDQRPIQASREHWANRPAELTTFKKEQGLNGPVILFVSRMDPDNRVDLLLSATVELRKKFPELKVVLIGKGEHAEELKELARRLDIEQNVRFLGAIYDEVQLGAWFCSADLFCYPANVGLSLLHAFGYALPVVTSDEISAQNPEIEALEHEGNGLLYKANDVQALTEALARILDNRQLQRRLSEGALRTVMEKFTLEKFVDGMEAAVCYAFQGSRKK